MTDTQPNLAKLREDIETAKRQRYQYEGDPEPLLTLLDIAEAAQQLLNELDDAIAGADLEAWNAPYRIEAPLFRAGSDRLRSALNRLQPGQ